MAKLILEVNKNSQIKSILHTPINIAIVCHLFLLTLALPTTLTQLYTLLCLNLILRHINKNSHDEIDFLNYLHDLPMPASDEFQKICFIAYKARKNSKIVFSSCELKSYGIDVQRLSGMGLLLIAPSTSVYGREKSYNFLHLTLQEFCAAFYISNLPAQKQHKCFKKYQFKNEFQIVWRFYSGITGLSNEKVLHSMLPSKLVARYDKRKLLELFCYVYEAHNDVICQQVGDHLEGVVDLQWTKGSVVIATVCYFLQCYKGKLRRVDLSSCDIGDEGCHMIIDALLSHNANMYSPQFSLNLSYNRTTAKTTALINKLVLSNCPIYSLNCGGCFHTFNYVSRLFKSLNQNTFVRELSISGSLLNTNDIHLLAEMLTVNNIIKVLNIGVNYIGPDGCVPLALCRNISLNKLIMGMCGIGDVGADLIATMLYHNNSITHIDLTQNEIGDNGVKSLVEHLNSHKVIDYLNLGQNKITVVGAHYLKQLVGNSSLKLNSLELSHNYKLNDEGVNDILQLPINTMEYIGLRYAQITSFNLNSLSKVKSVKLSLPDKCIDQNKMNTPVDLSTLKQVKLCDGSDTAYQQVISNINTTSITKLVFCEGHFAHSTVLELIAVLKQNDTIVNLKFAHVNITHGDCLLLGDMLANDTTIKKMKIVPYFDNLRMLEQSRVLQILYKLYQNYTLEELTLGTHSSYDQNVEVVEGINEVRQQHGVTPLLVKLSH